jgi:holin-like protein
MLLFFVPAVVAVVNYAELLMVDGWRIFLVIAISTVLVLGTTALVVDKVYRFELARIARRQARGE